MNTISSLTGANFRTYNSLLEPAAPPALGWGELTVLLRHLGDVTEERAGELTFFRNGHTHAVRPDSSLLSVGTKDLMALRKFLARSETPLSSAPSRGPDLLLIIGQAEARVMHVEVEDGVPRRLRLLGATGKAGTDEGEAALPGVETFDPVNFFEPVAAALQPAKRILILGGGTGQRSGMDQFVTWLQVRDPEVAGRILDVVPVEVRRLTEGQLLAKVRNCYASALATC